LIGLRKIYQACVIPQMLYGSSIWYNPYDPGIRAPAKKAIVKQFAKIQKRAAIIISRREHSVLSQDPPLAAPQHGRKPDHAGRFN
jgi:hypothetical protein